MRRPKERLPVKVLAGIDNEVEMNYIKSGGVLPYVFDRFA